MYDSRFGWLFAFSCLLVSGLIVRSRMLRGGASTERAQTLLETMQESAEDINLESRRGA
jgi:hypothetical protein